MDEFAALRRRDAAGLGHRCQKRGRRRPGEAAEVAIQMRLVGVPAAVGKRREARRFRRAQRAGGAIEADDRGGRFRRQPDLLAEALDQPPGAPPELLATRAAIRTRPPLRASSATTTRSPATARGDSARRRLRKASTWSKRSSQCGGRAAGSSVPAHPAARPRARRRRTRELSASGGRAPGGRRAASAGARCRPRSARLRRRWERRAARRRTSRGGRSRSIHAEPRLRINGTPGNGTSRRRDGWPCDCAQPLERGSDERPQGGRCLAPRNFPLRVARVVSVDAHNLSVSLS